MTPAPDSLTVLFASTAEDPERWLPALRAAAPQDRFVVSAEAPERVDVVLAAAPPPGALGAARGLRLVQSLWMGVDGLLADPGLPRDVPLARMVDPGMEAQMPEVALTHVLWAHRRLDDYARQQARAEWRPLPQPPAARRPVGVLGLGALGTRTALLLRDAGFPVRGWSRSPRSLEGVRTLTGEDGLEELLAGSEVVVVLLPLTPQTHGLLDAARLALLPPGAVLVNLARGAHVVEADLLAALDAGRLRHAVLDVVAQEPLPPAHPLWRHPRVTITPHVAARSDPDTCAPVIAENLERLRRGEEPMHLVDRARGY